MDDVERCLATARTVGVVDPLVVHGAQHIVLIAGSRVLRFPRRVEDAARLEDVAARHRVAHAEGLTPHPPVAVRHGPVGVAHLELVRAHGMPLPQVLDAGEADLAAVADSLADSLATTRRVREASWPFPQRDWVRVWAELPDRARRHAHLLPGEVLSEWIASAQRAAAVAARAPLGLLHGDLQGHNVLVAANRVSAVLDWDNALIGDPAMDTAAALHDFPAGTRERLAASRDWVAADLDRFAAYRATWELQAALWEAGDRTGQVPVAAVRRPRPAGTAR